MKWYNTLIIAIVLAITILLLVKNCNSKIKFNPLQSKADRSFKIDSISTLQNLSIQQKYDSLVVVYKSNDSTHKKNNAALAAKYYALRKTLSKLTAVSIDSLSQVVTVPASVYNDAINSGNICDTLLVGKNTELNIKDSIIKAREFQLLSEQKAKSITDQALQDQKLLADKETKKADKAKKLNKKIPIIALVCAEIGAVITILILK